MWMIASGDQSAAVLILEPDDIQRMKAGDFLSPGPETLALHPAEEIMELL